MLQGVIIGASAAMGALGMYLIVEGIARKHKTTRILDRIDLKFKLQKPRKLRIKGTKGARKEND